MIIFSDGDIQNHDNSYGALSDIKLKEQITDASSQWDDIKAVKVRNYKRNDDIAAYGDNAATELGVIAQELEEKHPEFVNTDDEGFKSVKYIDLLIAKIAELEARLEKLEK